MRGSLASHVRLELATRRASVSCRAGSGNEDVQWFDTSNPAIVYHPLNAYSECRNGALAAGVGRGALLHGCLIATGGVPAVTSRPSLDRWTVTWRPVR